jgi:hypothetical protein
MLNCMATENGSGTKFLKQAIRAENLLKDNIFDWTVQAAENIIEYEYCWSGIKRTSNGEFVSLSAAEFGSVLTSYGLIPTNKSCNVWG